jgi:hypothetical protein
VVADFQKGEEAYEAGDYATALRELRPLAEQGHAESQHVLAEMYAGGDGVAQDSVQMVEWYRKAAEQGVAWAQNNIGNMYDKGQGVAQDDAQAAEWFLKMMLPIF